MKKGFTLIELLLVMAVIAILIGILLPAFRGMQSEGYRTRTDKEMSNVQAAIEAFYKNNGSYPGNSATGWFICLTSSSSILQAMPEDYFKTVTGGNVPAGKGTYSYATWNDSSGMPFYIIGSKGTGASLAFVTTSNGAQLSYSAASDNRVISNINVIKY